VSNHPQHAELDTLLEEVCASGLEFIVVGGAAALLHGAPITTQDVDIVHRTSTQNVDRLEILLSRLQARVRDPAGRHLVPSRSAMEGTGQINLLTKCGPLDLLCRLHDGRGYDELLPHTELMTDGSMMLRVIDLPTLISIKASTGRARDRMVVPILRALLEESSDPE